MCGQGWAVQHLCSPVVTKAVFCLCRLMIISKLVVWHYYYSIKYSLICTYENALWMRCYKVGFKEVRLVSLSSSGLPLVSSMGSSLPVQTKSVNCSLPQKHQLLPCRAVVSADVLQDRQSLQEAVPPSPPDLRRLSDPPLEFVVLCPRDLDLCPFPVHDVVLPLAVIRDWF